MLMVDQMPDYNQTYLPTNSNLNTWWPTTQNEEYSYHYQHQLHFGTPSQAQPPHVQAPQQWTGYEYDVTGVVGDNSIEQHRPGAVIVEEPEQAFSESPMTEAGYPGEESEPEPEEVEPPIARGKRTRQSGGEVGPDRTKKRRKSADGEREPTRRSSRACLGCRKFKVRCMPGPSRLPPGEGSPCARCAQNDHQCVFEESKRGKYPTKKFAQLKRLHAHLEETLRILQDVTDQQAENRARSQQRSLSEPLPIPGPSSLRFY
ncbi:unnamed protein product [Rhizoctonia solani]|uniref:Zn(2)-C6 fungal-type domain-containing protein n=1 Tax=Rhizoctonia solani TaxID=456999 RepID=A0A8H3CZ00_9AGAM|nr:unnamed protein product [Rhizoctonia solani]